MIDLFPQREIFLQLGSFTVYWYGLLWALSFWVVWYIAPRLQAWRNISLTQDRWTQLIAWGSLGALVGGRLGYVLVYEPMFYLQHPSSILAIWQGGMASHGGFIGAGIALWLVVKRWKDTSFLAVTDVAVVPVALALALGRVGNWINLEIFSDSPIAIVKNITVAGVCYLLLRHPRITQPGIVTAAFLVLYATLRFIIEPMRDDPWGNILGLTYGQLLTLPIFITGVLLLMWLRKQHRSSKRPTNN